MELENPGNGDDQPELASPNANGGSTDSAQPHRYEEYVDSSCSTPYVSAPSSPGRGSACGGSGYFFSAPASPMHFMLSSTAFSPPAAAYANTCSDTFEFEFSSRCPSPGGASAGSMCSADELFLNGQIRPMKLSSHLQRPQVLAPLLDLDEEEEEPSEKREGTRGRDLRLRSRSIHRRTRSLSPLRNRRFHWAENEEEEEQKQKGAVADPDPDLKRVECEEGAPTPSSGSASSSRSSSGRNSKRWIFLKDLLYRSKSEGRERERSFASAKDKFWHSISFSPSSSKEKSKPVIPLSVPSPSSSSTTAAPSPRPAPASDARKPRQKSGFSLTAAKRPANGLAGAKRRGAAPSPHERHYTANRAQAEEMRWRTFLPYRQGILGCLGFSSRGYGAMNGLAKTLNPVSSR